MSKPAFRFQVSVTRFAVLMAAFAAGAVHAGNLRVTAVNTANNAVFDVTFSGAGGTTTTLNSDQAAHTSFRSLAYIPNAATNQIDLLVADTLGGAIVRYAGATGVSTLVWSGGSPRHPDGLSVDAAGNLYVISYTCGDDARSELWVLPRNPAVPAGAGFLAPRLIDDHFGGAEAESLKDTLVVRTPIPAAGLDAGDLLLLVGDDDVAHYPYDNDDGRVLVYTAASIQTVLTSGYPVAPTRSLVVPAQFPAGEFPVGMDFWPVDNSLLIATTAGYIRRFALSPTGSTSLPDFADGSDLHPGLGKLKTGQQSGVPYAIVLQTALNQIIELGAPPASGPNLPVAIVTQNVSGPQGLAVVSSVGVAAASDCASTAGCDILGGVIPHKVVVGTQPVSGLVFEESCVVDPDPRLTQYGTCTGHTLPVSQLCPGFGNTVIPDTLCGASGNSGKAFALIKTVAEGVDTVPGILVYGEAFAEKIVGGTSNPPCPQTSAGWAPRSNSSEGTVVEGDAMLELTGGCGSTRVISRGLSIYGIGLKLNLDALPPGNTPVKRLVAFADQKLVNLSQAISPTNANIIALTQQRLALCVNRAKWHLDAGRYQCAARKVWRCDQIVMNNATSFGSSSTNPNPYGDVRGRLANLFLTIDARILGHAPATSWPLAAPPARCLSNPEDD